MVVLAKDAVMLGAVVVQPVAEMGHAVTVLVVDEVAEQVVEIEGVIVSQNPMAWSAKQKQSPFLMRCKRERSRYDPLVT